MEKEFSFVEMFKYCFRKWVIILVSCLLCCCGFTAYTILTKGVVSNVSYKGSATIASLNNLYPEMGDSGNVGIYQNLYNLNLTRAIEIMSSAYLKNQTYDRIKTEYLPNVADQTRKAERDFFEALKVSKTSIGIDVSFISRNGSVAELELSRKIVGIYLDDAISAAVKDNPIFGINNGIVKSELRESADNYTADGTPVSDKTTSILFNIVLGAGGGIFLGLAITVIIFFADKRIKSYSDIAEFTGHKLLGVSAENDNVSVNPKLEAILFERNAKTVLFTSNCGSSSNYASDYADYSVKAGYKTLLMDLRGNGEGITTKDLKNEKFAESISDEKDLVRFTAADNEWKMILQQKEQIDKMKLLFDKVVISCDYYNDGALATIAKISDAYVVAISQNDTKIKSIQDLAMEIDDKDKAAGAIIYNLGNSYVGKTY